MLLNSLIVISICKITFCNFIFNIPFLPPKNHTNCYNRNSLILSFKIVSMFWQSEKYNFQKQIHTSTELILIRWPKLISVNMPWVQKEHILTPITSFNCNTNVTLYLQGFLIPWFKFFKKKKPKTLSPWALDKILHTHKKRNRTKATPPNLQTYLLLDFFFKQLFTVQEGYLEWVWERSV